MPSILVRCFVTAALLMALRVSCSLGEEPTNTFHPQHGYQQIGVQANLPVFYGRLIERMTYSLSWQSWSEQHGNDFKLWRKEARGQFFQVLPHSATSCAI